MSDFNKCGDPENNDGIPHFQAEICQCEVDRLRAQNARMRKTLEDLVKSIDSASVEALNYKYSRADDSYVHGAHTFFKLIGKSYPRAQQALSEEG